jgi:N-acetylmuramoyl-L-alanine amidase
MPSKTKKMRPINKIILHCTATPEGRETTVDDIRKWHKAQGWSDIGYHYVVYLDGTIHKGRPINIVGAHTQGHNSGSIGVTYVGGIDKMTLKPKDTRTDKQKEAMHEFLMEQMLIYKVATLHGHNEFAPKACPSFDVQKEYADIIKFYKKNK